MKNFLFLLAIIALFTSCKFARYSIVNTSQNTSLDFRTGKWLLNDIDAPNSVKLEL